MSGHEHPTPQEVVPPAGALPQPGDASGSPEAQPVDPELEADGVVAGASEGSQPGEEPEPEPEPDPEAQARALADRYLDLAQRTQADFDNYRKRMTREVRAAEARGIGRLARELLPALDNLERALAAADASEPEHDLSQGIRLVTAELSAALGRTGISGYDPTGEPFDPVQHEAVAQQPVEGTQAGIVVQVLQPGYRLNDAVLRPARVVVAS